MWGRRFVRAAFLRFDPKIVARRRWCAETPGRNLRPARADQLPGQGAAKGSAPLAGAARWD